MIVFQPYKVNVHNKIDSMLLLLMALFFISTYEEETALFYFSSPQADIVGVVVITSTLILLLYLILLITWKVFGVKKIAPKLKDLWQYIVRSHRENIIEASIETFDKDITTYP